MKKLTVILCVILLGLCMTGEARRKQGMKAVVAGLDNTGGAVQIVRSAVAVAPASIESLFPDGLVFSVYSSSFQPVSGGTDVWVDRSSAGNNLSQSTEIYKPAVTTRNGCPVVQFNEQCVFGRLVGIGSTSWTIAMLQNNQAEDWGGRTLYPTYLGDKAGATNKIQLFEVGVAAGASHDRADLAHGANNDFLFTLSGLMAANSGPSSLIYSVSSSILTGAELDGNDIATSSALSPLPVLGGDWFAVGGIPLEFLGTFYRSYHEFASIHVWNRALSKEERLAVHSQLMIIKAYLSAGGRL